MSIRKSIPKLYNNKDDCCGCGACYSICSVKNSSGDEKTAEGHVFDDSTIYGAIRMEEDEEGFLYPVIDEEKCIRCYRCVAVCPFA